MEIKTKADWIASAKYVVPLLPEYMSSVRGNVDPGKIEDELGVLVRKEDWDTLRKRFHEIWNWLPDRPDIRRHPFGRLCDLCSEDWVFSEPEAA